MRWLIDKFHYKTRLGSLMRLPMKLVPRNLVVPVLRGPMRGAKWVTGATTNGAWLGTLERDKLEHLVSRLSPGQVVWDIGANVGLYTLPTAKTVGSSGLVFAFEPMPQNLVYLKQHVSLNSLTNVVIVDAAVAESYGKLLMTEGDSPSEFFVDPNGSFEVPAIALDEWREQTGTPPPNIVKIDVEGAESEVLRGGAKTFSEYRPTVYLALHGERQRQECGEMLIGWGYKLISLEAGLGVDVSCEWLAEASHL